MKAPKDFEEFLESLNATNARYLVVGAYALGLHGFPRNTGDIDFFVSSDAANAKKVLGAIEAFGFKNIGLTAKDLTTPDRIIQLGYPPFRIDVINSIDGVDFEKAWANREKAKFGKQTAYFLSLEDLIRNKRASGRKKDLEDLMLVKKRFTRKKKRS